MSVSRRWNNDRCLDVVLHRDFRVHRVGGRRLRTDAAFGGTARALGVGSRHRDIGRDSFVRAVAARRSRRRGARRARYSFNHHRPGVVAAVLECARRLADVHGADRHDPDGVDYRVAAAGRGVDDQSIAGSPRNERMSRENCGRRIGATDSEFGTGRHRKLPEHHRAPGLGTPARN